MSTTATPTTKRRVRPAVWFASAATAAGLVLGVNGTFASWTQAIIENTTNDVQSAASVALKESSAAGDCVDTATSADNTAQCTTVNKYGGTATPLKPGDSQTATVTLTNTGSGTGTLTLTPGACGATAVAGTGADPATYDLCTQATVALACTGDASYTMAATALSAFTAEKTIGSLATGKATTCTFTVSLPSTTPSGYADQIAAQLLTWKLTAA